VGCCPTSLSESVCGLYRSGLDYISPHADKTLDIEKGTPIVNVSLGATRVMQLKPKKNNYQNAPSDNDAAATDAVPCAPGAGLPSEKSDSKSQRVRLAHNTAFILGWETNRKYTHGIKVRADIVLCRMPYWKSVSNVFSKTADLRPIELKMN
jgi:hypothetical protein